MRFSFLKQQATNRYDQAIIAQEEGNEWVEESKGRPGSPLWFAGPFGGVVYTVYFFAYYLTAFPIIWSAGRIAGIFFSEATSLYSITAIIVGLVEILLLITLILYWPG